MPFVRLHQDCCLQPCLKSAFPCCPSQPSLYDRGVDDGSWDWPVAAVTLQEWLLQADKLFCMTLDEVLDLRLPQWLPVGDAEALVVEHLTRSAAAGRMQCTTEDVCPVPNAQNQVAAQVPPLSSYWRQSCHVARLQSPQTEACHLFSMSV